MIERNIYPPKVLHLWTNLLSNIFQWMMAHNKGNGKIASTITCTNINYD